MRNFDNKNCLETPNFGDSITFELYKENTGNKDPKRYVSVKYNGSVVPICEEMAEEQYCEWPKFTEFLLKNFMVPNI